MNIAMLAAAALEFAALLEKAFFLLGASSRVIQFSVSAVAGQTVDLSGVVALPIWVYEAPCPLRHSRIAKVAGLVDGSDLAASRIAVGDDDGLPLRRHEVAGSGDQV